MKHVLVKSLLQAISDLDRQTFSPTAADTWYELLADVDYDDAMEAVRRHYRMTDARIGVRDVLSEANRLRRVRHDALARERRALERHPEVGSHGRSPAVEAMLAEARRRTAQAETDRAAFVRAQMRHERVAA